MSLTANFDYCVQLGIESVREIFHLALKQEDRYPHNLGPFPRELAGRQVEVEVRMLNDLDALPDLSFQDERHIRFSFPFEVTVTAEDAPDPELSRVTLRVRLEVPAPLDTWEEEGEEVLGLSFHGVTASDVEIVSLEGLPSIDVESFTAAVHTAYDQIQHTYVQGGNVLVLYDGDRDPTLVPPNHATPYEIEVELVSPSGQEHVRITAPIHVDVVLPGDFGTYDSYGRLIFHRPVERTDSTITVDMTAEPGDPDLATVVELDTSHFARSQVEASLQPLAVQALSGFGVITEPAFTDVGARELIRAEAAAYLKERRYPCFSPKSGDPDHPLSTPVGFLLVSDETLAILMNRRNASVDDHPPELFLDAHDVALAVGRARVDELIQAAIDAEFPGLDSGGHHVETEDGEATLEALSVTPSDPGTNGESVGHLWVEGEAEVHISCWPDPDVSFEGPIYVTAVRVDTEEGCILEIQPSAGDFDIDMSCCDVFIGIIIPIVGWIMLAIISSTINEVGGELIEEITEGQGDVVDAIPPVVNGIAEVSACLIALRITSRGFIFPGEIYIRRLGESFEDRADAGGLPRP